MKKNKEYLATNSKYLAYHETIDRLMLQSDILNGGGRTLNAASRIYNRGGIEMELLIIRGNKNGGFFKGTNEYPSHILIAKADLEEMEIKFEKYCERVMAAGRRKPQEMPPEMLEQKLKIEAKLFVLESEAEELDKRLAPYLNTEKEKSDNNVLRNGPRGSSRLKNGVIVEMDGMTVSEHLNPVTDEVVFIINDTRAKQYNGYLTADYLDNICRPWAYAKLALSRKVQAEAKEQGIPLNEISQNKLNGQHAPWPKMPDECINYLKKELVEAEPSIKRTKK